MKIPVNKIKNIRFYATGYLEKKICVTITFETEEGKRTCTNTQIENIFPQLTNIYFSLEKFLCDSDKDKVINI